MQCNVGTCHLARACVCVLSFLCCSSAVVSVQVAGFNTQQTTFRVRITMIQHTRMPCVSVRECVWLRCCCSCVHTLNLDAEFEVCLLICKFSTITNVKIPKLAFKMSEMYFLTFQPTIAIAPQAQAYHSTGQPLAKHSQWVVNRKE